MLNELIAVMCRLGNADGEATARLQLGLLYRRNRQCDQATVEFEAARNIHRDLGHGDRAAFCTWTMGLTHLANANYQAAEDALRDAAEYFDTQRKQSYLADCLRPLGVAQRHRGDYCEAERSLVRAREIYEVLGQDGLTVECQRDLDKNAAAWMGHLVLEEMYLGDELRFPLLRYAEASCGGTKFTVRSCELSASGQDIANLFAEALERGGCVTADVNERFGHDTGTTSLCPIEVVGEVEGLPAYRCLARVAITLPALVTFRGGGDTTRAVVSLTHSPAFDDEI